MTPPIGGSAPDTQPPTAPGGLHGDARRARLRSISPGRRRPTTSPSTGYRVERCQGAGCSNFVAGRHPERRRLRRHRAPPATSYSYRVRAADAAGNLGPFSAMQPRHPGAAGYAAADGAGSLKATAASSTRINLSWTAATDNVAVTGYRVERCQGAGCSQLRRGRDPERHPFADTGPRRRRATATGCAPPTRPATSAPSRPRYRVTRRRRHAAADGARQAAGDGGELDPDRSLWTAATDNVASPATGSSAARGRAARTSRRSPPRPAATYADTGLSPSTSYSYRVRAADAAGNLGAFSATATATTPAAADTQPPTAPAAFRRRWRARPRSISPGRRRPTTSASPATGSSAARGRAAPTSSRSHPERHQLQQHRSAGGDQLQLPGARRGCGRQPGRLLERAERDDPSLVPTRRPPTYARRVHGDRRLGEARSTWRGLPSTRQRCCHRLSGRALSGRGLYELRPGRRLRAARASATQGLAASTTYRYRVRAADAAGNLGGYSAVRNATTPAASDTQPPTAPGGLTASAVSGGVRSTWPGPPRATTTAVAGYRVERCQGGGLLQLRAGRDPERDDLQRHRAARRGTSYGYRVRAADAAGNLSGYSSCAERDHARLRIRSRRLRRAG